MTRHQTIATLFAFVSATLALQTTPSLAFSSEAQQRCAGDAMRLCSSEIPDIPRITNIGFLVDGHVFHPGDALTVPEEPVATLLLPVHAPWSKISEVIDYVRAVGADQAFGVHDALLSDVGQGFAATILGEGGPGTPT